MICYWWERCMLRPSWWFVTGQSAVCYDQVDDLLLVRTLYGMMKFMICYFEVRTMYVTTKLMIWYWSERCMLRPSWWFVNGQNTVCYDQVYDLLTVKTLCYDQVYDLLLVRTLYVTTKFMICFWSERCMLRPSLWFVTGQNTVLRPSLWFVIGQNAVCYNQVYDLLLVKTLCYDQVYDLLLVRTLYGMT